MDLTAQCNWEFITIGIRINIDLKLIIVARVYQNATYEVNIKK